jgi:hypothetical protein
MEAGSVRERPEIAISCEERNPAIDTALGNEGISEAGLSAFANPIARNLLARCQ